MSGPVCSYQWPDGNHCGMRRGASVHDEPEGHHTFTDGRWEWTVCGETHDPVTMTECQVCGWTRPTPPTTTPAARAEEGS